MITDALSKLSERVDLQTAAYSIPAAVVLAHVIPWLLDPHGIRKYPGPFLAKFSDIWLGYVSKKGHRSEVVHEIHRKYGMSISLTSDLASQAHTLC